MLELRRLGSGTLLVTEMLPRGDSLWWSPDARTRVAELRVAYLMRLDPSTESGFRLSSAADQVDADR